MSSHRRNSARRRPVHQASAHAIEALESRLLLSTVTWTGAASDNLWMTPGNWSTDALPGAADDVTINIVGNPTITLGSGIQPIRSLNSSDPLNLNGGTLAVSTTIQLAANLILDSGVISGGTISGTGGAELLIGPAGNLPDRPSGYLEGVTIAAGTVVDATNPFAGFYVENGLTLNGTLQLGANNGGMFFSGTQTLSGSGQLTMSHDGKLVLEGGALTIGSGVTVHGQGSLSTGNALDSIVNDGTISADGGGTLTLGGTVTTSMPGAFTNNALLAAAAGSTLSVNTSAHVGGTLLSSGQLLLPDGAVLDAATVDGNITFLNETIKVINGLTLANGAVVTLGASAQTPGVLNFVGTQILGGSGQLLLTDQANTTLLVSDAAAGQPATLTIGTGVTVRGQGIIGGDADSILLNLGSVIADVSGKTLQVATPSFNNQGTATSANDGILSIASTGTIAVSGGNVQITAAITAPNVIITGGDLSFIGTAPFSIQSLTLSGSGVLDGTAPIIVTGSAALAGGSLAGSGTLTLAPNAAVTVSGNVVATREVDNAGTVQIASGSLELDGGGTQSGSFAPAAGASLVFGGSGIQTLSSASGVSGPGTFVVQGTAAVIVDGAFNVGATIVSGNASLELVPGARVASIGTLTINGGTFICGNAGLDSTGRSRPASLAAGAGGIVNVLTAAVISGGTTLLQPGWTLSIGSSGLTFIGAADSRINLSSDPVTPARLALGGDVTFAGTAGTASIHSIGAGAVAGQVDLGGTQRSFVVNGGSATMDLAIFANVTDGSLRTSGAGRMQIASPSSFAGGVTIAEGTLEMDDPAALGTGAIHFAGGTLGFGPGVATIGNALTAAATDSISIDVGASSRQVPGLTLGSALNVTGSPGGALVVTGSVTLQNDLSINNSVPVTIGGAISGTFAVVKTSTGTLTLGPSTALQGQSLQLTGGTVVFSPSATPATDTLRSLTISPTSRLDIGNCTLLIDYGAGPSPADTIHSYLRSAFASGGWSGSGLGTSGATPMLGYADGADGVVSGLAAHTVIVRPAIAGDINLDGKVDFSDLLDLAQHYGQTGATWDKGDMNYDATVGFSDLLLLAQHYGQTASVAIAPAATSPAGPPPLDLVLLKRPPRVH